MYLARTHATVVCNQIPHLSYLYLLMYFFFYLFVVVSQQSGILSNLGTNISSPNSESDNHALLDEKEDSYFSEIRNFISNSELNQACSSSEKRYELAHTNNTHMHRIYFEAMATNHITCQSQTRSVLKLQSVLQWRTVVMLGQPRVCGGTHYRLRLQSAEGRDISMSHFTLLSSVLH